MRHAKDHRKLGRTASHRKAMLSNMVASLIQHKRIKTTVAKAKEARRFAERCVTFGKKGTVSARKRALIAKEKLHFFTYCRLLTGFSWQILHKMVWFQQHPISLVKSIKN